MSSVTFQWRIGIRYVLIVLWIVVFLSQLVMYTTLGEIIGYLILGLVLFFVFLKFGQSIRSPYKLLGIVMVASFVLGLVPYKIRVKDWALFFFQSAKDVDVTYFVDPYMNVADLGFDLFFPVAHFVLMFAISKTYSKPSG